MNYAEEIKARVTMREVAEYMGYRVSRDGYMLCPFHREKTPSFRVYPGEGGYHCFGCGESGDVIRFVQSIEGIGFMQACEKLNDAFMLNLPIGHSVRPSEAREAARKAYQRRKVKAERERTLEAAKSLYWRAYDAWLDNLLLIQKNLPKSQIEGFSDVYAEAVKRQTLLEYALSESETLLYETEKGFYSA